jgi:hypothetical protein
MAKKGLYDNIHAKRLRIKKGSKETMRTPGSKGAPTEKAFKQAEKTIKEDVCTMKNKKLKSLIETVRIERLNEAPVDDIDGNKINKMDTDKLLKKNTGVDTSKLDDDSAYEAYSRYRRAAHSNKDLKSNYDSKTGELSFIDKDTNEVEHGSKDHPLEPIKLKNK